MSQTQTPQARPVNVADFQARAAKAGALSLIVEAVTPQPKPEPARFSEYENGLWFPTSNSGKIGIFDPPQIASPFGIVGDLLWARETWHNSDAHYDDEPIVAWKNATTAEGKKTWVDYRADEICHDDLQGIADEGGFKSPVTMPRWASRFTFEITELRVVRFNDLTDKDANDAGFLALCRGDMEIVKRPRVVLAEHWNAKHAKTPELQTDANPWVWCYSIKPAPTTKEA